MRTENLYYFLEVAQTKSITQAAKNLYISQQSLSRIISLLENEFHTTLFIRKKNGVDLTKAGTLFLAQAKDLLSIYNQMHMLDASYNTQRCRIAIDKRINPRFFSSILNLISDYPQIKFSMQEKHSTLEILESIQHDATDLGIAIFSKNEINQMPLYKEGFGKTFTLQTLESDNLYVLFHEDFPLSKAEKISIEALLQYPFVFYTKDTLYYGILKNFPSHTLNVFLETDNLLTTLDCINSKNAISIFSGFALYDILKDFPHIKIIPINESINSFSVFTSMRWNNNNISESIHAALHHTLKNELHEHLSELQKYNSLN